MKGKIIQIENKKKRDSNIELLRIILMIVIVAHHYVVNSGIMESINQCNRGGVSSLALIYGWGGKTAINCFVLITGWFMCRTQCEIKWKKLLSLYIEIKLYRILIYLIFLCSGYAQFSLKELYKTAFGVVYGFGKGFTSSFLAFYALIPFINRLLETLDKKTHGILIALLLSIYSIFPTFFLNSSFEYVGWYVTLYLVVAYIKIYPARIFDSKKITGFLSLALLVLSWCSVVVIYFVAKKINRTLPYYYFVADSNKLLAFLTALFVFCFFKNISLGQNRFINIISSATFGVLLIHASSDTMRRWLWQDMCRNVWHFEHDSLGEFMLHAVICTISVFTICTCIDLIRQFLQRKILFLIKNQKKQ